MEEWTTIQRALFQDESTEAELCIDRVPLTDHTEWTVYIQRLKPNTNYTKSFGWFRSQKEAFARFVELLKDNPEYKVV